MIGNVLTPHGGLLRGLGGVSGSGGGGGAAGITSVHAALSAVTGSLCLRRAPGRPHGFVISRLSRGHGGVLNVVDFVLSLLFHGFVPHRRPLVRRLFWVYAADDAAAARAAGAGAASPVLIRRLGIVDLGSLSRPDRGVVFLVRSARSGEFRRGGSVQESRGFVRRSDGVFVRGGGGGDGGFLRFRRPSTLSGRVSVFGGTRLGSLFEGGGGGEGLGSVGGRGGGVGR